MSGDLVPLRERSNKDLGRALPPAMITAMTFPGGGRKAGRGDAQAMKKTLDPKFSR